MKAEEFLRQMDGMAQERREKELSEVMKENEERFKAEEERLGRENNAKLAELNEGYKRRLKEDITEIKVELFRKTLRERLSLISEAEDLVVEKLRKFAESKAYDAFLKNSVKFAEARLGEVQRILCRKEDLNKVSRIKPERSEKIRLGGIIAVKDDMWIDLSFDTFLKRRKRDIHKILVKELFLEVA